MRREEKRGGRRDERESVRDMGTKFRVIGNTQREREE